jgi:hypothetical protein
VAHSAAEMCRLMGALSAAGMPSACVGGIDATRIVVLERMAKLTIADRTIAIADVHGEPRSVLNTQNSLNSF